MPREPIDENAMSGTLINNQPLILDRLKFAAQTRIGATMAADTRIYLTEGFIRNELIFQMESTVLADKRVDETYQDTVQTPAGAFQHFKADYSWRWTVWYLAWICWIVRHIAARWPVRYETHTLEVRFRQYDTYPRANIGVPDLGKPVMYQMIDPNPIKRSSE